MLVSNSGTVGLHALPEASPLDGIMLAEHTHRIANDMMAAIAALQLCRRHIEQRPTCDALGAAIERLSHIAAVQRSLLKSKEREVDLDVSIERLSRALLRASSSPTVISLELRLERIRTGSDFAWRLSTVLAEIIANAIKHAFREDGGVISITVSSRASGIRCTVVDDGRGAGDWHSRRSGHGSGIVDAIVAGLGGTVVRQTSTAGTRVTMDLPLPSLPLSEGVPFDVAGHALDDIGPIRMSFRDECGVQIRV